MPSPPRRGSLRFNMPRRRAAHFPPRHKKFGLCTYRRARYDLRLPLPGGGVGGCRPDNRGETMIRFTCPKCGEDMEVPDSLAGNKETCPTCGNVSIVPAQVEAPRGSASAVPRTAHARASRSGSPGQRRQPAPNSAARKVWIVAAVLVIAAVLLPPWHTARGLDWGFLFSGPSISLHPCNSYWERSLKEGVRDMPPSLAREAFFDRWHLAVEYLACEIVVIIALALVGHLCLHNSVSRSRAPYGQ